MVSLGCAKNRVDAENLLYRLREKGYILCEDPAMSDAAVVNTCGFIESAKQESIDEILELAALKKEGKIKALVVTGCLAERYRELIRQEIPEVDAVVSIGSNAEIADAVEAALNGEKKEFFSDKMNFPMEGGRIQSTEPYCAYLKIAEGCDNRCSYCAIPLIRGGFRSRKMENIIDEAARLAENGVKELLVIAQDTTRYGEDLYGEPKLAELLTKLCRIDGFKWIRVLYCYPDRITDELIDVIAKEDKIVKYIDLPLQHCSENILKAMNRRGNRESLSALINKIRARIPEVVLRTTMITGFPDETEEDFCELAEFAKELRFERLGCFAYSQEENTPAAEFENQIDEDVKNRRAQIIMEQQEEIMEEYAQSLVGKTVEVLVEGYDRYAECFFSRSRADAPEVDGSVFFTAEKGAVHPGDFVKVRITETVGCDPVGELIVGEDEK